MDDSSNSETYLKWILVFIRIKEEKKLDEVLQATTEMFTKVHEDVKKYSKVPKKKSVEQKTEHELEVLTANLMLTEANAEMGCVIGACYNLFCQLLADDPQVQWDRMVSEVHNKDPWVGLNGIKYNGLHMKTSKLLEYCIMFHKLEVFHCDVSEWQKAYMMGSLRKPFQMTIQNHMSGCKTLNGYIALLPMLRDSAPAVASTKKGNIPFNDATSAGIILATCPTEWQNQYKMNHRTIPESPRAMPQDLENIEKVYVERTNNKA
jgi:hypothetical protein